MLVLTITTILGRHWQETPVPATPLAASPFPPVQRMNEVQLKAMSELRATALAASAAATPRLRSHLDSDAFRAKLHECCPSVATRPAEQLLEMLREMSDTAELVHSFDGSFDSDMTIEIGLYNGTEYFASLWQLRNLGYYGDPMNITAMKRWGHPAGPEDASEEGVFKLPPFDGPYDLPTSYEAASGRLHYIALNLQRVDVGNPMFGNVTAIFSPSFRKDAVAASPIDSGLYVMGCNKTYMETPGSHAEPKLAKKIACNEGDITPGVTIPTAMDHVLLNNRIFWSKSGGVDTLARAFARTHAEPAHAPAKVTNASSAELIMYIEPNVLANALYSENAIKLLVGSFYALFGSTRGGLLRQFAAARRVALTWAIGACSTGFISDENVSFAGNVRLLDWPTSGAMLNATASPGDATSFAALWDAAADERAHAGGNLTTAAVWRWWAQARSMLSGALRLSLPRPGDCASWERTLGKSEAGECVAYLD